MITKETFIDGLYLILMIPRFILHTVELLVGRRTWKI
jgi:hypothetical protein